MTNLIYEFDPIIKCDDFRLGDWVHVPSPYTPGWTHCGRITAFLGMGLAIIRCDRADYKLVNIRTATFAMRIAH